MPEIDFFNPKYQKELSRQDECFGIIEDGVLAHSVTEQDITKDRWDVTVNNHNKKGCVFTPIDHNIVVKDNDMEISQCDGMLRTTDNKYLIFIEVKSQRHNADSEALKQLASTIKIFIDNHSVKDWKTCRAYIVNKQHPIFYYSNKTTYQDFYKRTGFRIFKSEIVEIL